ncbi:MAG: hypothetical protein WCF85_17365 [Rhodospirillaceae bacterium]
MAVIETLTKWAIGGEFKNELMNTYTVPIIRPVYEILPEGWGFKDLLALGWDLESFCLPKAAVAKWLDALGIAWPVSWGARPAVPISDQPSVDVKRQIATLYLQA